MSDPDIYLQYVARCVASICPHVLNSYAIYFLYTRNAFPTCLSLSLSLSLSRPLSLSLSLSHSLSESAV